MARWAGIGRYGDDVDEEMSGWGAAATAANGGGHASQAWRQHGGRRRWVDDDGRANSQVTMWLRLRASEGVNDSQWRRSNADEDDDDVRVEACWRAKRMRRTTTNK